jgi:Domain of unknown function (DUF1707)
MAENSGVRASDQERERVAQDIREHFAAGRLTEEELDDRVQSVYRAQTHEQLRALMADLPKLPATAAQQRAELVERRRTLQRRLLQQTGGGLGLFVLCTVIWLASGAQGQFWPVWVALVTVIPLLRNGWRLYGPAPELDRVEHELTRREQYREERRRDALQQRGHRHRHRQR